MKMIRSLLAAALVLFSGGAHAQAYNFVLAQPATTYVTTTGNDTGDCKSWLTACATIQQAITNLPANGGTVEIGYGTFTGFTLNPGTTSIAISWSGTTNTITVPSGTPIGTLLFGTNLPAGTWLANVSGTTGTLNTNTTGSSSGSYTQAPQNLARYLIRGRGIGSYYEGSNTSTSVQAGQDATKITNGTAATNAITINGANTGLGLQVLLEDFAVESTASGSVTFASCGTTSCTLSSNWAGTTGQYSVFFNTGQVIPCYFTNGATTGPCDQNELIWGTPGLTAHYATTQDGINISNVIHLTMHRVASRFNGRNGLVLSAVYWGFLDQVYMVGNALYGIDGTTGGSTPYANLITVQNSVMDYNGDSGVRLAGGNAWTFIGDGLSFNGTLYQAGGGVHGYGAQLGNGGPFTFINNFFEANAGVGIKGAGGVETIIGNYFTGNATTAYGFSAASPGETANIIGNMFLGHYYGSLDNGNPSMGVITGNQCSGESVGVGNTNYFMFSYNGAQSGSTSHVGCADAGLSFNNQTVYPQTLAANGAVTLDFSKAITNGYQKVTLQANATSSSITNAVPGQVMTIQWIQDATGSRTYAWPANVKFNAGTAPTASTTANYIDAVTCVYDGTNCNEIARSVGIH